MNIVIFGATGATGQQLVMLALAQRHVVTAFVRNPSKLRIRHPNLKMIQGDVVDYQLVEKAVRNQDAVLSALGAAKPFKYDQSVVSGISNIILAMNAHGINRFIYLSFAGVKETRNRAGFVIRHIAPRILATEITAHEDKEKMIQQSLLHWTIVRPPTLTNGKYIARTRSGEDIRGKGFVVSISRADVAGFMLSQLEDHTFLRKKPLVMY
jgi:putative NADH-flavin reductase